MIHIHHEERLLKTICLPYTSEKASATTENTNTIVLKIIAKDTTKAEIKAAIQRLFEVKIKVINTLVVKGKVKRHGQHIGHRRNWKKAYVTLEEGQNLNFDSNTE